MNSEDEAATFALIHGGGGSSWDWHLVEPELRGRGHDVVAVDLPIEDPENGISEYAETVVAACEGRPNLVVVGHSFGGMVAPVVCTRVAAELLVLVAGMIPRPGESPGEWWGATGHNDLGISFATEEDVNEVFYNGVPADLVAAAAEHDREHSGASWSRPVPLSAWPEIPTRYLLCRDDRCFPPAFARSHAAERLGLTPDEIDGGHMVALGRPAELAERLDRYWTELRRGT